MAALKTTCALQSLAKAVSEPSGWDIAGVLIAGAAAVGTLWIAYLNLRLMKAQRVFDNERVQERRKLSRLRLATYLRQQRSSALLDHAKKSPMLIPKIPLSSQESSLLTIECDADQGEEFVDLLEREVDLAAHSHFSKMERRDTLEALLAAQHDFEFHLEMWLSDPSAAIAGLLKAKADRERDNERFRNFLGLGDPPDAK